ncbi:hypothetical protein SCOR_22480 [Sulfidibacter corallicola]|uniref:Uncharacterized protein n=1 Tax=Sulfidibacter corallicola TaxID=2818388 RepID=A0A8A4TS75_SULCO|nr:hypothetical protein [Sulfidibacter corallicola]QTD52816.1 hypothetical protein J3U87_10095 [Sulfidibacter corallicola]
MSNDSTHHDALNAMFGEPSPSTSMDSDPEWNELASVWQSQETPTTLDPLSHKLKRLIRWSNIWNYWVLCYNLTGCVVVVFASIYFLQKASPVLSIPYVLFLGPLVFFSLIYDFTIRRKAWRSDAKTTSEYLALAIERIKIAIKIRVFAKCTYWASILFIFFFAMLHFGYKGGALMRRPGLAIVTYIGLILFSLFAIILSDHWKARKEAELARFKEMYDDFFREIEEG